MNIIYASVQCSERKFNELFEHASIKPGQQIQRYNRLLAEGLAMQENMKVTAVTAPPLIRGSYKKRFLLAAKENINGIDYVYLPILNIHRVADLFTVVTSFFICLFYGIKKKESRYIFDILCAPVALGALLASKLLHKECTGIVTDLPDLVYQNKDKVYHTTSSFIIKHCTSYIFLTKQMNDIMNPYKKPFTIIEGIAEGMLSEKADLGHDNDMKVCMYTGTLDRKYGIEILLKAFIKANIDGTELHIYGDGNYKDEVIKMAEKYHCIRYFGVVMNNKVIKAQRNATVLINPRPSGEEFTKYSFPSKNIEYMSSGTPVIATKLPGIPEEYNQYVYLVQDETEHGFCEVLKGVLCKDKQELMNKGLKAQEFVLTNKNKYKQAYKILMLINRKDSGRGIL